MFLTEVDIGLCGEPRLVIRIQGEGIRHQLFDSHSHSFHIDCLYAGRDTQTRRLSSHLVAWCEKSNIRKNVFLLWKSRWPDGEVLCCHLIYNIVLKKNGWLPMREWDELIVQKTTLSVKIEAAAKATIIPWYLYSYCNIKAIFPFSQLVYFPSFCC